MIVRQPSFFASNLNRQQLVHIEAGNELLIFLFAASTVAVVPHERSLGPIDGWFGFWFRPQLLHFQLSLLRLPLKQGF